VVVAFAVVVAAAVVVVVVGGTHALYSNRPSLTVVRHAHSLRHVQPSW